MIGIGRVEVTKIGVEIRQAEVAAKGSVGQRYQVRIQDRQRVLIHAGSRFGSNRIRRLLQMQ